MTLNDKLAALFKARPNIWIDGHELARVAGYAGWRTRVSNLRTQRHMTIENRCRRSVVLGYDDAKLNVVPKTITISEYRLVAEPEQLPLNDQWSVGA